MSEDIDPKWDAKRVGMFWIVAGVGMFILFILGVLL